MKKVLLSLIFTGIASLGFATRTIDWSVEQIISPTKITHNVTIQIHAVCKNNGNDTAMVGDSIFSRAFLNNGQLISNWGYSILSKKLNPGDTIHIRFNLPGVQNTGVSFSSTFAVQSVLQNRPDLTIEGSGTSTNNLKTVTIDYINDKGFGVNVNSVASLNNLNVYPNPSKDIVNIDLMMLNSSNATLNILDVNGKSVYTSNILYNNSGFTVDTTPFAKGVYFVQVSNGTYTTNSKLIVE